VGRCQTWFSANGQTFNSNDDDGDGVDHITMGEIKDPVVIEGGTPMRVYERSSIERWLREKAVDPYTRQDFSRGYRLISVIDINPRSRFNNDVVGGGGGGSSRTKLSRAQMAKIYNIFRGLRTEYGQDEVKAREITKAFCNPDGETHRLRGLNHVSNFKGADFGYVSDAEEVFKEVAKVICDSDSPPHDWQATRLPTSPEQQPYEDADYSPQDISEVFTWTHDGIKYEVLSDGGDDDWYFRGTFTTTAVHDRRRDPDGSFFRDVEIRGENALTFALYDEDSPYLRDIAPEYIEEIVREEKESLIEALGGGDVEEAHIIDDIQSIKYSLMRLFRDKYICTPQFPEFYRIVDCIRNARNEIILMRGVGIGWHRGAELNIKAKHWDELNYADQYETSMGRSRPGSEYPHNIVFLVCEDSHHDGDNIVSSEVESFWQMMNLRFSFDD